jgi:hypothetical protein
MYCRDLNWISTDVSEVRAASIIKAMSERSVKDSVYSPLLTTLHEPKTRTREACANTDQEILYSLWQEAECRFDVARATCGAQIELC